MRWTFQYLCHNFHHHVTPIATNHTYQKRGEADENTFYPFECAYFYRNKTWSTVRNSQEALGKSGNTVGREVVGASGKLPFFFLICVQIYYYALLKNKSTKICQQPRKLCLCLRPYLSQKFSMRTTPFIRPDSLWCSPSSAEQTLLSASSDCTHLLEKIAQFSKVQTKGRDILTGKSMEN